MNPIRKHIEDVIRATEEQRGKRAMAAQIAAGLAAQAEAVMASCERNPGPEFEEYDDGADSYIFTDRPESVSAGYGAIWASSAQAPPVAPPEPPPAQTDSFESLMARSAVALEAGLRISKALKAAGARPDYVSVRGTVVHIWDSNGSESLWSLAGKSEQELVEAVCADWAKPEPQPRQHCACGQEVAERWRHLGSRCGDCLQMAERRRAPEGLDARIAAAKAPDADPTSDWTAWAHPGSEGP